ncbi:MAG TPA: MFS transporter [Xanthobacteraceae bacterium]|nr:MFS transporter [Xanthobacteraceae bacterium]
MAMPRLSWENFAALAPRISSEQRRAASVAGVAHALHDGYTDLIYILLPLWQAEFGLTYAALGVLRSMFVGAMACLQIPAGLMSERFGAPFILALGTALAGAGYCFAGLSTGFAMLLCALLISGIGASAQHPIASALVARAFAGPQSLKALGAYNFSGDLGKMTIPATLSLMLLVMAWRPALLILGCLGVALAAVIMFAAPRYESAETVRLRASDKVAPEPKQQSVAFALLTSIGIIDSATRMAFLLFLPFVLTEKGASLQTVGLALTLVFAGGAAGKLACAFIGARIGAIGTVWLTEGLTATGILALLPLPLDAALVLLPLIGVALNGTSSVLYGSVPDLITPQWRTRALSIFYTGTIGSGALSPVLFGRLGDLFGVRPALMLVASFVLLTLPIAALLRRPLAQQ